MRLATLRTASGTSAVRVDAVAGRAVEIDGFADVGTLLAHADWRGRAEAAAGAGHALEALALSAFAPVVPRPSKVICVGLNYRAHILEMGRALPAYPTLFAKFGEALIGPGDDILIPRDVADTVDWEGELAVIVGSAVRHAGIEEAQDAIAGFTVMNDITVRAHQYRTTQWLQGKTFETSTPLGPVLVTPDEFEVAPRVTTTVEGERVQDASTGDLVFAPAELVAYLSRILTLQPGDVIATGTPGGVGHAANPPRHLADGESVVVAIEGIGAVRNRLRLVDPPGGSPEATQVGADSRT